MLKWAIILAFMRNLYAGSNNNTDKHKNQMTHLQYANVPGWFPQFLNKYPSHSTFLNTVQKNMGSASAAGLLKRTNKRDSGHSFQPTCVRRYIYFLFEKLILICKAVESA